MSERDRMPTTTKRFTVAHMRGYHHEWWVHDNANRGNGTDGLYARQEQAVRYAELRNAGVRREAAMQAVSTGAQVIRDGDFVWVRTGDLAMVEAPRTSLIPAKVVKLARVPVPGAPSNAFTQIQVTVMVTSSRPGYDMGTLLVRTGFPQIDTVIPRKNMRRVSGFVRVRTGVFDV